MQSRPSKAFLVGAPPDIASIVVLPATPLATDPGLALLPAAFSGFLIAATMASPPVETATRRFMHSANDASPAQQAGGWHELVTSA